MFFFRRVLKLNPALLQLFVGLLQIVASVGHVHKRANPVLVVIGGEQQRAFPLWERAVRSSAAFRRTVGR